MAAPINVYLIGKQGCGKSAVGNTLLRRKTFTSRASSNAVTTQVQGEIITVHNRQIHIWDTPGITEVQSQTDEAVDLLNDRINELKSECHVLMWVARYGELCASEDEYLLKELSKKLSKAFVKNHTIVVITHKDKFESDTEDSGLTFDNWVKQQTGFFKKLCSSVAHKVLPIDNRSKPEEQLGQIFQFLLQETSFTGSDSGFELVDHPLEPSSSTRPLPTSRGAIHGRPAINLTPVVPSVRSTRQHDVTTEMTKLQCRTNVDMTEELPGAIALHTKAEQGTTDAIMKINQVDLDIMLLGKTGVGKSRTGNSILDRKAFRSSGETKSATNKSQKEITRLDDGRILRVVNTPGVGDTRETTKEENLMTAINEAIVSNPMGYHALIIVLRFGSRFTQEDIDTMQFLKKVFGNNFVKKYCIVVMSCGDQFLHAVEVGDIEGSFTDWCKKQDSDFQTLFKEVEGRVLLFNNTLKDRKEKDKQRNELVAMIDGLVLGGRRSTNTKFEKARQELEKQIHQEKTSKLALEVQDEMNQLDLDIVLLGKTGVGKSKTGNSILDRKAFITEMTTASVTFKSKKEVTRLDDGRILRVVDTPGVGDTRETTKDEKIFMTAINEAILSNPMGYHALIIVLRFGSRFTKEDIETMQFLKKVFGENFVKKYCIVVMSYGDQFSNAVEEGDIEGSFTDWCKKQNSEFQTLFKEVEGRVLLFNNMLKDRKEKDKQRNELVAMIDGLVARGRRYTNTKFEKARQELEKQIHQGKISKLALEVQEEISLILHENNRIQEINNVDTSLYAMTRLIDQISSIQTRIDQEKVQSVELLRLCSVVQDARHHIEQELRILQTKKDLENKKNAEMDQALRPIKEQVEELRNDNKKLMEEYIKVRDENNRSWFSKLWDRLCSFLFGKSLTSQ